jgi:hypothetical protein
MKLNLTFENILNLILDIIISYNLLLPKLILLILFILILKYQIKSLFTDWRITLAKKDPTKFFYLYKIKNFYFIWFWIFIYFFIFIFLFFSFRIVRIGYKLDLNFIKQTYTSLYTLNEYLLIILLTIFIIIFSLTILLILRKLKTFLETYLLQKHLYLINYQTVKKFKPVVDTISYPTPYVRLFPENSPEELQRRMEHRNKYFKNGLYKKIFYYFYFISYIKFIKLVMELDSKFDKAFIDGTRFSSSEIFNFSKHIKIICDTKYNIIIPISIFLYELIFCNFTIIYLFYFLPFYFLYTIWYKLSCFWYLKRIADLDVILYELYYDFPIIMYLELDQEDLNMIFRYILGGLNRVPNNNDYSDSSRLMHYKRFILYENWIYINKNTGESISKEEYQNLTKEQKQDDEKD